MQTVKNRPTPAPTATKSRAVSICGTNLASTCRSGSAAVTATPGTKPTCKIKKQIFDFSQRRSDFCVDGRHENFRTQGKKPHSENQKPVANKKLKTNPSAKAGMLRDKSITIVTIGSTLRAAPAIFSKVKAAVSRYTSSFTLFHLFCFIMP